MFFIELQNEEPTDLELWCYGTQSRIRRIDVYYPKINTRFIQPYNMFKYLSKSGVYI